MLRNSRRKGLLIAQALVFLFVANIQRDAHSGVFSVVSAAAAKDGGDSGGGSDDNGSDDGGSGNSGSGKDDSGKGRDRAKEQEKAEQKLVDRFVERLRGNPVKWARITTAGVEVRYSDGWSESVLSGRYRLVNGNRTVTERAARASDLKRLKAAAASAK